MRSEWQNLHENIFIPQTLVAISILLLIFSITLHFHHHFKCRHSCTTQSNQMAIRQKSNGSRESTINYKIGTPRCCCSCGPADGEDYDFFPMAFLLYLIYLVFMCFLLVTRTMIILYASDNNSWNSLVSNYKYPSINDILSINNSTFDYAIVIVIIDFMLVYLIMIMCLVEQLFTFYRFYNTFMSTKKLTLINFSDVIKKFTLYAILFTILYAITINLYFWIFPFVILLYCVFNIYCNMRFASVLIMSYSRFMNMHKTPTFDNANQEILNCAYFMRKISVICTIIQSIYLLLFMVIFYVNINLIIIYLPILWCISSFLFMLNFVRNRLAVQAPFQKAFTLLKSTTKSCTCCSKSIKSSQHEEVAATSPSVKMSPPPPQEQTNIATENIPKHITFMIDSAAPKDLPEEGKRSYDLVVTAPENETDQLTSNAPATTPEPKDVDGESCPSKELKPMSFHDCGINSIPMGLSPQNSATIYLHENSYKPAVSFPGLSQEQESVISLQNSPTIELQQIWSELGTSPQNSSYPGLNINQQSSTKQITGLDVQQTSTKPFSGLTVQDAQRSVEYTMQSRNEMSVQTEIDVDGNKQEEFNRYLANNFHNTKNENSPDLKPISLHAQHFPSFDIRKNSNKNDIDIVIDLEDIKDVKKDSVKHRLSEYQHKLDINQLMLQLILLKKLGFDARNIKKSFGQH